jgi:hypothetical protein
MDIKIIKSELKLGAISPFKLLHVTDSHIALDDPGQSFGRFEIFPDAERFFEQTAEYAKTNNIPVGPGRGSGAGSLVAYLLSITDIDSIKFELLFERFLNVDRLSMPDIDTDFCYERRDEVIEYVKRKYGKDHVAQIVTFGTLAARAAIKDVGRVLELPYSDVDQISKLVGNYDNISAALKGSSEIQRLYNNDEDVKKCFSGFCSEYIEWLAKKIYAEKQLLYVLNTANKLLETIKKVK